jgi:predicted glycoside hydrolase/deacetylase ChbG (UPF0249 family)
MSAPAAACGRLVLHADDFGLSGPVTSGVLRGFRQGLLTSPALAAWLAATGVCLGRLAEITEGAAPPAG